MKENDDNEQEDFFDISNLFQEENSDGVRVRGWGGAGDKYLKT